MALAVIGRKGPRLLPRRGGYDVAMEYLAPEGGNRPLRRDRAPSWTPSPPATPTMVILAFSEFKSAISQKPAFLCCPIDAGSTAAADDAGPCTLVDIIYEPCATRCSPAPAPRCTRQGLGVPRAAGVQRQRARRPHDRAMDNATNNAKKMIGSPHAQGNRARQAAITKELMEIIGGAEAIKD